MDGWIDQKSRQTNTVGAGNGRRREGTQEAHDESGGKLQYARESHARAPKTTEQSSVVVGKADQG